jgi:RND superfamily putative drug exporter
VPGALGRLGGWCAAHLRLVAAVWAVGFLCLGALAPQAEQALSGAGWHASGSESVQARAAIEAAFPGRGAYSIAVVVDAPGMSGGEPRFKAAVSRVEKLLAQQGAVSTVGEPRRVPSREGALAVVTAGAGAGEKEMVAAARDVGEQLEGGDGIAVAVTGPSGFWADFNDASKEEMLEAELRSWPLTLAVLTVAFGSLIAAGLPLLLTIVGLVSAIGALFLLAQVMDVSIWAVNFALMFALAVGIDYSLLIVVRFRATLRGGVSPRRAVVETMETAGRAVLFSGFAVMAALLGLLLIPSPPFRTVPIGMILAVAFVLAASLTLLPALLARIGDRIDRFSLPWSGAVAHRSERFARWARFVWRRPLLTGGLALAALLALSAPLLGIETRMPSLSAVPVDAPSRLAAERLAREGGSGASSRVDAIVEPGATRAAAATARSLPSAAAVEVVAGESASLISVTPREEAAGPMIGALRAALPAALVGGGAVELDDLESAMSERLLLFYAALIAVGFAILFYAVRAPVVALVAVLLNLLATGAAFGVAKLVFQDGLGAGAIGFESSGFVTAWGPIFFFALIFALAMDYSVFLLSAVREEYQRSGDPREALVEGMARSGRVINAAAAVMVCVFFTFALADVLPPKEMGAVLGVAVLLDAILIRLLVLPAILRLLGDTAWQMPALLERRRGTAG